MILFLATAASILGLLVGIPFWTGPGPDGPPLLMAAGLAVAVLVSAVWGKTRRD